VTTSSDAIRVALIGYGYAGRTFHAPLITATPGLVLTVIGSSQVEQVLADLSHSRVVPPEAAATDAEVDLVVIATPNRTHARLAAAALSSGKHVIVDKPFTVSLQEARDLAALARQRNRLLSVFQNRRWDSDFLAVKSLLRANRIGEPVHFESHFDRFRPEVQPRWREQAGPAAGVWYDLGPHLVDQALCLFGLPATVTASFARQRETATVIDWAHVVLEYGRLRVLLHASMLAAGGSPRFIVHGTRGTWIKCGFDGQEDQLRRGIRPGVSGWGEDPQPGGIYEPDGRHAEDPASPAGDYRLYYAAIRDALLQGGENPVTPSQAIAVMAVLETAAQSASSGKTLPLPLSEQERSAF